MIITRASRVFDSKRKPTVCPNEAGFVFFIRLQAGVLENKLLAYMCEQFRAAGYVSGAKAYPGLGLSDTSFVVLETPEKNRKHRTEEAESAFAKAEKLFADAKARWFDEHYFSLLNDYEYHRYELQFDYLFDERDMVRIMENEGVPTTQPIDKSFWEYNRKTGWHLESFVGVLIRFGSGQDSSSFSIDSICTKRAILRARAYVARAEAWSLDTDEMTAYDVSYLGKATNTDVGYPAYGRYYGEMSWNDLTDLKIEVIMRALDFAGLG